MLVLGIVVRKRGVTMECGIYYSQDIRKALLAADQATGSALQVVIGEGNRFVEGYKAGYLAALTTIALAFGLIQPEGHTGNQEWQSTLLPANVGRANPNVLPRPPPFSDHRGC